ncbi:hypothetical protein SLEP1_g49475 [Rubroshorea leprosula]|uniref:CCHC-type domain-containing protein n=1 Tax=Rubroshorea leprosula TaxID=152421 RepID=A0AAV5LY69_9ROSI|nr:hypothetical protein SLEP1_g49475 [Rubroshorea leprosula]
MKNHQSRPIGSAPLPEANATSYNNYGRGRGRRRGQGRCHGRNHGNNHGRGYARGRNNTWHRRGFNPKYESVEPKNERGRNLQKNPAKVSESFCYRCGAKGHWERAYRTARHLVDLYQTSLNEKGKGKDPEMNFIEQNNVDLDTHLDVADFFEVVEKLNGVGDTQLRV